MKKKTLFLMLVLTCVYSLAYAAEGVFIFDISGTYNESLPDGTISMNLVQDSKGKVTGSGTINTDLGSGGYFDIGIDIDFELKGKVKTINGIATFKYKLKGRGDYYLDGEDYKITVSESATLVIDQQQQVMHGTVKVKLCTKGEGCYSDTIDFNMDLPSGMTGGGILEIDIESDEKGKKLEGDATLTLSNGDTYNLDAKGKYNSKKDETNYSLKGSDEGSKAIKIKLTINDETGDCTFFSGKALGQQLKY